MQTRILDYNYTSLLPLLQWANSFEYALIFYGQYEENYPHQHFPKKIVVSNRKAIERKEKSFEAIKSMMENSDEEFYGFLSYDLKNEVEELTSDNKEVIEWPQTGFFEAEVELEIDFDNKKLQLKADHNKIEQISEALVKSINNKKISSTTGKLKGINASTSAQEYIETVEKLQQHIIEGDIYEINYCINFDVDFTNFDPLSSFDKLIKHSPNPFACFLKWKNNYVLCASPERFLKAEHNKLISQPIKGTARRATNQQQNDSIKKQLQQSTKERAENMMIVDLVRNDLSKSSVTGSTRVDEMFGIYSFPQVHQMISTISSEKLPDIGYADVLKNTFPMGSMTGAPKIRAMQLIEKYEKHKRGLFSGAIGKISKDSMDFNVVIRTLFFDSRHQKLHYQVGSAITYDAIPEEEYKECLLKADAIKSVLGDL